MHDPNLWRPIFPGDQTSWGLNFLRTIKVRDPNEIWDHFIYSHISERIERIPHDRDPQWRQRGGDQPVGDRPERRGWGQHLDLRTRLPTGWLRLWLSGIPISYNLLFKLFLGSSKLRVASYLSLQLFSHCLAHEMLHLTENLSFTVQPMWLKDISVLLVLLLLLKKKIFFGLIEKLLVWHWKSSKKFARFSATEQIYL